LATATGKATSVLLMAIMVAGGLTFAFPPAVPAMAQSSNPNLTVSAESSTFSNYFSGAQVVEVAIIDPDIDETNEAKGEPDVTVNGNDLRMVQATDGKWYAYIADVDQARMADATVPAASTGQGLDFGTICLPSEAEDVLQEALGNRNVGYFSGARAVAFPLAVVEYVVSNSGADAASTLSQADCADERTGPADTTSSLVRALTDTPDPLPTTDGTTYHAGTALNVVREPKAINDGQQFGQSIRETDSGAGSATSASDTASLWPFIQLYDFNPTGTVVVKYSRGGGTQSVTLNYDVVDDYASLSLDRTTYPGGAEVHFTITDTWLDIDPTDQDSWSWDVVDASGDSGERSGATAIYYQAFDENGDRQGATPDLSPHIAGLSCVDCRLGLDFDAQRTGTAVVRLDANNDSSPKWAAGGPDQLLTVTETDSSSGVFTSYDESDDSALVATADARRDTTATITYDATPQSISVGFATATIDIQPTGDAWLSGQEIPVVLTDADFNRNTRADEDFDVLNADAVMPGLVTGTPATVYGARAVVFDTGVNPATPSDGFTYEAGFGANSGTLSSDGNRESDDNRIPGGARDDLLPSGLATLDRFDGGSMRTGVSAPDSSQGYGLFLIDYGSVSPVQGTVETATAMLQYDFGGLQFVSGAAEADRDFDIYAITSSNPVILDRGAAMIGTLTEIQSDAPARGTIVLGEAAHNALAGATGAIR